MASLLETNLLSPEDQERKDQLQKRISSDLREYNFESRALRRAYRAAVRRDDAGGIAGILDQAKKSGVDLTSGIRKVGAGREQVQSKLMATERHSFMTSDELTKQKEIDEKRDQAEGMVKGYLSGALTDEQLFSQGRAIGGTNESIRGLVARMSPDRVTRLPEPTAPIAQPAQPPASPALSQMDRITQGLSSGEGLVMRSNPESALDRSIREMREKREARVSAAGQAAYQDTSDRLAALSNRAAEVSGSSDALYFSNRGTLMDRISGAASSALSGLAQMSIDSKLMRSRERVASLKKAPNVDSEVIPSNLPNRSNAIIRPDYGVSKSIKFDPVTMRSVIVETPNQPPSPRKKLPKDHWQQGTIIGELRERLQLL